MRIEYKFCPNLTIIDTPGECAVHTDVLCASTSSCQALSPN